MKKHTDGKWYWYTIEEFNTLVLFDCLDKIHKYNEEIQRIYTNNDGLSSSQVWREICLLSHSPEIKQAVGTYNALVSLHRSNWPKIILNRSQSGFAVFDDPTHTLV